MQLELWNTNWREVIRLKSRYVQTECVTDLEMPILESLFDNFWNTVKPEYNDHPRGPEFVTVVDRWSCSEVTLCYKNLILELQNGGRYRQVVVSSGLTISVVFWVTWLYNFLCFSLNDKIVFFSSLQFHSTKTWLNILTFNKNKFYRKVFLLRSR